MYFSTKNPINKLAINNRRLLKAAEFHFVHSVDKDRNITSRHKTLGSLSNYDDDDHNDNLKKQ